MHDVIDKLTPEQALEVVARLSDKGGGMRYVVLAGALLTEWRKCRKNSRSAAAMDDFIQDRCSKWTKYLIRAGRRV
jgi:hypothetical protein